MTATSAALVIVVFGLGLPFGMFSGMASGISLASFINGWSIGFAVAVAALAVGFVPALLVGATVYAALAAIDSNSYIASSLIAIATSFALDKLVLGGDFALVAFAFAAPTSLLTHLLFKRFQVKGTGSNNSFKPKPLRSGKNMA